MLVFFYQIFSLVQTNSLSKKILMVFDIMCMIYDIYY